MRGGERRDGESRGQSEKRGKRSRQRRERDSESRGVMSEKKRETVKGEGDERE